MKILRYFLYLIAVIAAVFIFLIVYASLSDFDPPEKTVEYENTSATGLEDSIFSVLIWNIGYSGLGADMDFFYDGGKNVRTSESRTRQNLKEITSFLSDQKNVDFKLLQEVDQKSRRSYKINQYESIKSVFPGDQSFFGKNYDVFFVPTPPLTPYGSVLSGLATYSKHNPSSCTRYSFPGNYAWPKGLFMLDRCFLVCRYPLRNGKELILINTHNSAYDDGSLRKVQMEYLKKFILQEYKQGNYILTGGDWNQTPFGFAPSFENNLFDDVQLSYIEEGYPAPAWKWLYDPLVPSNRRLTIPYDREMTPTTVIDFFLTSPNIDLVSVRTTDLQFVHSDHQPVLAIIKLRY